MNTITNPSLDRNDLVNLISKSQEYIEILKSIISIEELQNTTSANLFPSAESQFSPEALTRLEEKISQTKMIFENDSTILLELPGKPLLGVHHLVDRLFQLETPSHSHHQ